MSLAADSAVRSNPDEASISPSKQKPSGNQAGTAGLALQKKILQQKIDEVVRFATKMKQQDAKLYNELFPYEYAYMMRPGWVPVNEKDELDRFLTPEARSEVGLPPLSFDPPAASAAPVSAQPVVSAMPAPVDGVNVAEDEAPPAEVTEPKKRGEKKDVIEFSTDTKLALLKFARNKGWTKDQVRVFLKYDDIPVVTFANHKEAMSGNAAFVAVQCQHLFNDGLALVRSERMFVRSLLKSCSDAFAINDQHPFTVLLVFNIVSGVGHDPVVPEICQETKLFDKPVVGPHSIDYVHTEKVLRFVVPRTAITKFPADCSSTRVSDWIGFHFSVIGTRMNSESAADLLQRDCFPWFEEKYLTSTIRERSAGTILLFADKTKENATAVFECMTQLHKLGYAVTPNNAVFRFYHKSEDMDLQKLLTMRQLLTQRFGSDKFKIQPDVPLGSWAKADKGTAGTTKGVQKPGYDNYIVVRSVQGQTITPDLVAELRNGETFKKLNMKILESNLNSIKVAVEDKIARELHRTFLDSEGTFMWYYPRLKKDDDAQLQKKIEQEMREMGLLDDQQSEPNVPTPPPSPPLPPPSAVAQVQSTALDTMHVGPAASPASPVNVEERYGNALYNRVLHLEKHEVLAAKITGMLLECTPAEIESLLNEDALLADMVNRAQSVIEMSKQEKIKKAIAYAEFLKQQHNIEMYQQVFPKGHLHLGQPGSESVDVPEITIEMYRQVVPTEVPVPEESPGPGSEEEAEEEEDAEALQPQQPASSIWNVFNAVSRTFSAQATAKAPPPFAQAGSGHV